MTDIEKIESVLAQENYKVEKGKVFRLDAFGEWSEQHVNHLGKIQLRDSNGHTEMFNWGIVQSVIDPELKTKIDWSEVTPDAYAGAPEQKLAQDEIALLDVGTKNIKKRRIGVTTIEIPKELKKQRTKIDDAEIKTIRKMLSEGSSINKISEAINSSRLAVSYIVKQIKAGKKLRNEK